jgi:WD40 repeat protein
VNDCPEGKRLLAASSQAMYTPHGYLFFARGPALLAQAFDPEKLEVIGMPVVVSENAGVYGEEGPTGLGTFSVSCSDTLATTDLPRPAIELSWFDRGGRRLGTVGPPGDYRAFELSPDGTRVAVVRFDSRKRSSDVSIIDLGSGVQTQITDDPWPDANPVWDPRSERLAFRSLREGQWRGFIRNPARSNDEQTLPAMCGPESWFPDGNSLLCSTTGDPTGLWKVPVGVDQPATPLVLGLGYAQGRVSPNGSWLAYSSDHQERRKVFVLALGSPQSEAIVLGPGDSPRWRHDSRELFFLTRRTVLSVPVNGSRSQLGQPQALFEVPVPPHDSLNDFLGSFGVSADGSRFLFPTMTAAEPRLGIQVVRHWNANPPR